MLDAARPLSFLFARRAEPVYEGSVATRRTLRSRARAPADSSRQIVLIIAGTRPECIKLAPLVRALRGHEQLHALVVNSGQHAETVRRTFAEFGCRCDVELATLPAFAHLAAAHEHLRVELHALIASVRPSLAIVQGDTLTAYSGARAAAAAGCAVAHVEAGLRTTVASEPFPEEWFRRRIARYAQLHFAPSESARLNLLAEGIDPRTVHRVGNTGIDSLGRVLHEIGDRRLPDRARDTVLVTLHRRENYDRNAGVVCDALIDLVAAKRGLEVLLPVHPNPRVADGVRRKLASREGFTLVEPMSYRDFIQSAAAAALIISDSGGIQEEAPHLGTPLLVPRCNTERPEGIETGFVELVAADRATIVRKAMRALASPRKDALPIDDAAPFGAGNAASKIVRVIESVLELQTYP